MGTSGDERKSIRSHEVTIRVSRGSKVHGSHVHLRPAGSGLDGRKEQDRETGKLEGRGANKGRCWAEKAFWEGE